MEKRLTIDRIEGTLAIVEHGGSTYDIPMELLPSGCEEGDTLVIGCEKASVSRIKEAEDRLRRLEERDPGDDVIEL